MPETPPSKFLETKHGKLLAAATKGAIGSIPIVGNLLSELFGHAIAPALEARRERAFQLLAETVTKLQNEQRLPDWPELVTAEPFVTAVIHLAASSLRAEQDEKRILLRNAVVNSVTDGSFTVDQRASFLRSIDALTPSHVVFLRALDEPSLASVDFVPAIKASPDPESAGALMSMLQSDLSWYGKLVKDLTAESFIREVDFSHFAPAHVFGARRSTELGRTFLRFVKNPD